MIIKLDGRCYMLLLQLEFNKFCSVKLQKGNKLGLTKKRNKNIPDNAAINFIYLYQNVHQCL